MTGQRTLAKLWSNVQNVSSFIQTRKPLPFRGHGPNLGSAHFRDAGWGEDGGRGFLFYIFLRCLRFSITMTCYL